MKRTHSQGCLTRQSSGCFLEICRTVVSHGFQDFISFVSLNRDELKLW